MEVVEEFRQTPKLALLDQELVLGPGLEVEGLLHRDLSRKRKQQQQPRLLMQDQEIIIWRLMETQCLAAPQCLQVKV